MRLDKLTTKFHEALSDAQSIALGADHAYIEPAHVLLAMLFQKRWSVLFLRLPIN
jgi:ATP-dependent Clp protease ATP-binding subunit ClpB